LYRKLDFIHPQKRAVLVKEEKTGLTNFRAISMGPPGTGRIKLEPNVDFDDLNKAKEFKKERDGYEQIVKRKRMANQQMFLALR